MKSLKILPTVALTMSMGLALSQTAIAADDNVDKNKADTTSSAVENDTSTGSSPMGTGDTADMDKGTGADSTADTHKDMDATKSSDKDKSSSVGEAVSDSWITTKVKTELATHKDINSKDISVKTVDGVVSLTGSLSSPNDMQAVKSVVSEIKGVKSVDTSELENTK